MTEQNTPKILRQIAKKRYKYITESVTHYELSYIYQRGNQFPRRRTESFSTRDARNARYEKLMTGKTCTMFKLYESHYTVPTDIVIL